MEISESLKKLLINRDCPTEELEKFFADPDFCGLIADVCEYCHTRANVINGETWLCGCCGYINEAKYAEGKRRIFFSPDLGLPFSRIKPTAQKYGMLALYIVAN